MGKIDLKYIELFPSKNSRIFNKDCIKDTTTKKKIHVFSSHTAIQ